VALETGVVESFWINELTMINPKDFRNFLFDLDGTLVNSSPLHAEAFCDVLRSERPALLPAFSYEQLKGLSTPEAFRRLGIAGEAEICRLTVKKQTCYRDFLARGRLSPLPGARELLRDSARAGHRLFLVTSGSGSSVRAALAALDFLEWFEGIFSVDDVKKGKPSPETLMLSMQRQRLANAESIVFEDSESCVNAARAANLSVVGVNNPGIESMVDRFFSDLTTLHLTIAIKDSEAL
jgi:HAD superfamily hydrolase (TIGR01509 family)